MIRYQHKERCLRCDNEARPGILCVSSREVHNWGAFLFDSKFDPLKHQPGGTPIGPTQLDDEYLAAQSEPVPAAELVAELSGPTEVRLVGKMLMDTMHMALDGYFGTGNWNALAGLQRLHVEFAEAIWERFPDGPPPDLLSG